MLSTIRKAVFSMGIIALMAGPAFAQPVAGWTLVWSDEFNDRAGTSPDAAKWNYNLGAGGWGNGELQTYTNDPGNAFQDGDGHLVIRAKRDASGKFTSARLLTGSPSANTRTANRSWQYGWIEARVKLPLAKGVWPAFWMLGQNIESVGWPTSGEIDIMENFGTFNDNGSINNVTANGPGYTGRLGKSYKLPNGQTVYDDYHVYAVNWSRDSIEWFLDGILYYKFTPTSIPLGTQWVFNQPFFILLNVAIAGPTTVAEATDAGDALLGTPDPTAPFPAQDMMIDYVRIYQTTPTTEPFSIITGSPLSSGVVTVPYSPQTLAAGGGIPPYSNWTVTAGNLPLGLSLNADTGVITGVPINISGRFSFTVAVRDAAGANASKSFEITIQPRSSSTPLGRVGSFAQVACGFGWRTTMTLINLSVVTVDAQINLHADDGSPMLLPLRFLQFGLQSSSSSASLVVGPNQSVVIEAEECSSLMSGWADVQATGGLWGYSIFRFRSLGMSDSEGTMPLDPRLSSSMVLPYDDTNGNRTGVALANQSPLNAGILATLLDENGVAVASTEINIPAMGHTAFFLSERFPNFPNRLGIIQLQNPAGSVTGLALRFSPSNSFTSVPIIR